MMKQVPALGRRSGRTEDPPNATRLFYQWRRGCENMEVLQEEDRFSRPLQVHFLYTYYFTSWVQMRVQVFLDFI
jgi:hypothetical protein